MCMKEEEEADEEIVDSGDEQGGCKACADEVVDLVVESRVLKYGRLEDEDFGESSDDEERGQERMDEHSRLRQRSICRSPREQVWWVDQV